MEMMKYPGLNQGPSENRRAFPRWPMPYDLIYGKARERRSAEPLEISECGLSFRTSPEPVLGSEIAVEFRFGPHEEWIQVLGVVKYVEEKKVGIEFLNLRMADRLRIIDFMSAGKKS
jgi:hypothetical protein